MRLCLSLSLSVEIEAVVTVWKDSLREGTVRTGVKFLGSNAKVSSITVASLSSSYFSMLDVGVQVARIKIHGRDTQGGGESKCQDLQAYP